MIKQRGTFEQGKAELSLMALPQNLGAIQVRTIEQAVNGETPTLATVRKYHGEAIARNAVIETIAFAAGLLNIGKNLQPHQIGFLADEILRDWYWLKIGELKFIMEQGVRGVYGELYDRLDFNIVLEWIAAFDGARTEIVERNSQRAETEAYLTERKNSNGKETPMPDFVKELAVKFDSKLPYDKNLPQFEPDSAFDEMIADEWETANADTKTTFKTFEAFRLFRIEQTKRLFEK